MPVFHYLEPKRGAELGRGKYCTRKYPLTSLLCKSLRKLYYFVYPSNFRDFFFFYPSKVAYGQISSVLALDPATPRSLRRAVLDNLPFPICYPGRQNQPSGSLLRPIEDRTPDKGQAPCLCPWPSPWPCAQCLTSLDWILHTNIPFSCYVKDFCRKYTNAFQNKGKILKIFRKPSCKCSYFIKTFHFYCKLVNE